MLQVCMALASAPVKQQAKVDMWSSANGMISMGGKPMRYPQQQEVLDMVSWTG
jgi:hypothetical protein